MGGISCCNCYFDYYLLRINKDPEYLNNRSVNVKEWPKACWMHDDKSPGVLFHVCSSCLCKVLKYTTAAKCDIIREILNSTYCFINSQHLLFNEENCLNKVHFELNNRVKCDANRVLDVICTLCKSKICLLVIDTELNFLDKSYILTEK